MDEIAGVVVAKSIEKLSSDEFRRMFVRGLCQTAEFGHLAAAGSTDLTSGEKAKIVEAIKQFIPRGAKLDGEDLDIISWKITSRAVALR